MTYAYETIPSSGLHVSGRRYNRATAPSRGGEDIPLGPFILSKNWGLKQMMQKRNLLVLVLGAILITAVGGTLVPQMGSADPAKPVDRLTPEQREAVRSLQLISDGFAAVAEMIIPSVVTISSEKLVQPAEHPMTNDPFFRRFFGDLPQARPFKQHGLGSGVIVDETGYILTNNHVVRGADDLTVILSDGRRLSAKVVGTDARTDLAVLKVEEAGLPAMSIGNSDELRIGEWVLAVGSPFSENLQATVTTGIVSAVGRSGMNLNEYEDFIQTDAAINPGNSGGALVNLDGELVGINSAIASRTGGSNGIGFAIPTNLATDIMADLIEKGRVTRGWLGVGIQDVDQNLALAMDLESASGVLITSVLPDGPASEAGLEQGDVIVRYDEQPIRDGAALRLAVARTDPGRRVEVVVVRDGRERAFRVKIAEREEATAEQTIHESQRQDLGLGIEALTPGLARRFQIEATEGLVVTTVSPAGPADEAGVQVGDVIREVNRRPVRSPREYVDALESSPEGKPVLFLMERRGNTYFVALHPDD